MTLSELLAIAMTEHCADCHAELRAAIRCSYRGEELCVACLIKRLEAANGPAGNVVVTVPAKVRP